MINNSTLPLTKNRKSKRTNRGRMKIRPLVVCPLVNIDSPVGASLLAMDVNEDSGFLIKRGALKTIASRLAPTVDRSRVLRGKDHTVFTA
jgi:hypothetical protein